jgi:hypothetical protein
MHDEVMRKRSAEVVRSPAATLVDIPRPIGTFVVRRRTKEATLREVGRLQRRGYVHSASALARIGAQHGGGYAVKIALLKPLPQPMPGWAKGCALVGAVMSICSGLAIIAMNAFASLLAAAAVLPWALIMGGLVVAAVAAAIVKRAIFGGGISISQNVNIR